MNYKILLRTWEVKIVYILKTNVNKNQYKFHSDTVRGYRLKKSPPIYLLTCFMKKIGLDGDSPCHDCGTDENPVWYTDNVFWNNVVGKNKHLILCTDCFIVRAEKKFKPTGWRLIPEFPWRKQIKK